ncbi:MAG TPA: response regulator [Gaiellaceae bacterium]|nr:response regulator [Gaiellaceae bacterium]
MSEVLPRGTVTFLFTDIEGSTQLLKRLGERYGGVLLEHQRLLRDAFARWSGLEVDTQGDAFFIVFPRAKDAVAGALAAQRALRANPWSDGVEVRVRMGMHTGEPAVAADRYIGLGVHRAARICAAAHGGQVLLSQSTQAVLADDVLPDIGFLDLGEHRLKDLDRAERIYQLVVPDLQREFPPLRTLGEAPAPFAGREPELAQEAHIALDLVSLRVVVADDSVLLRQGLCRLLEDAGFEVAGSVGDADTLLREVAEKRPAVAITDIRMPPTHTDEGLVAAHEIRRLYPDVGVLVLSQYLNARYALQLLEHYPERVGYLLKERVSDVAVLLDAIRRIAQGECVIDPTIVARLMQRRRSHDPLGELTEEEREVLSLVAEGHSDEAIAQRLAAGDDAVEETVGQIFAKIGLADSADDVRRVLSVLTLLRS